MFSNVFIIYELSSAEACLATRRQHDLVLNVVLKSNLIRSIQFGTAVTRRLKRALPLLFIFTSLVCQLYIREFFWSLNLSLKIELANRQVLSSRPKREFNQFHVAGRATFAKKCTKKCDIRSKVCYLNLIHFCHSFDSN